MPGVRLSLKTNMEDVFKTMDQYVAAIQSVAVPRAVNKLADQAQVVGLRLMAKRLGLPVSKLRPYLRQVYARVPGGDRSVIEARGAALPLILFSPSPSAPTRGGQQRGKGVSVRIGGKRVFIPHAFIQRMPGSGHIGVFARGAYGGKTTRAATIFTGETSGRFQFARSRLPINELFTASVPQAFQADEVTEGMNARLQEQAAKVLRQEISFASRQLQ